MSFDKAEVKEKANGQWDFVVSRLVPEMAGVVDEAVTRPSRHYPCHIHGGEKDMRFYRDFLETGGAVCTCGKYPDGFALIGAANGWSFSETVEEVGKLVFGSSFEEEACCSGKAAYGSRCLPLQARCCWNRQPHPP